MAHQIVSRPSPHHPLVPRFDRGSTAWALCAVEQRLASAERELRIQFTRIAQLKAEVDLLRAGRRSPDAADVR